MSEDLKPELPWGEAQWEQLMRESEAKSAKFGELLETLVDHPDRDEIIANEMGWDRDDPEDDRPEWQREQEDAAFLEAMNREPTEEEIAEAEDDFESVNDIPAYKESYDWSMRVFHALKEIEAGNDDVDELIGEAVGEGHAVAVKIAGGHGMGYDDESICGNIVRCKRSLDAADNSLRALTELAELRPDLRDLLKPLINDGTRIRGLVVDHIEEMRSSVWWE